MARKSTPAKAAPAAKAAPVTGASAKDLRRLEALKERPASSREEKKAWTEERRTLKADLAAAEREAKRGAQAGEAVVRADRKNEAEVRAWKPSGRPR